MAHTSKDKKKLLARIRRIRGQVEAIERAIEQEHECSSVLLTVAACRGAMNSLMAEILEGHIRHHVLDGQTSSEQDEAAEEVIELVRRYLK
ncbi:MAG: metal/formaldehyde-sensitive transcriptional repressor [Planctomycetota bacterium]|nr:MAG: metal/formaldehyde-sensitive transcriptional repressor [Planctomycetota bacterium]REJ92098.1 MAG: metal/formaldehyde-sensitive transcriptional repressor [Planctomycetota bacterium]REK28634.1 MAG: metal/formaldehyde-sensitive transcriptional repressor [Planctomycetota bacterium]REK39248.1 MAG: metal/formaldehyde-sensitive transcriptional repressor [Planctomycetota bacterium]